jgi:hypothetical protein
VTGARAGWDAATWRLARPFTGRIASPDDVEAAAAVFALGETVNAEVLDTPKPQPVIWHGDDEEFAALLIQAERHEAPDGAEMEVGGLLLPNGDTAVALMEDLEAVEDDDVVWLALLEAQEDEDWDSPGLDDEDEDEDEDDDR